MSEQRRSDEPNPDGEVKDRYTVDLVDEFSVLASSVEVVFVQDEPIDDTPENRRKYAVPAQAEGKRVRTQDRKLLISGDRIREISFDSDTLVVGVDGKEDVASAILRPEDVILATQRDGEWAVRLIDPQGIKWGDPELEARYYQEQADQSVE